MLNDFIKKHKTIIVLSIVIFLLMSLNLYMLYLLNTEEEKDEDIVIETKEEPKEKMLKVDIKGEINHPGLYEVNANSRVMDIIEKAGGLTDNADTSVINLSKKVKDEMVILIYSKEEVQALKEKDEEVLVCPEVNDACANEDVLEPLIEEKETSESGGKISLNEATLEELQTLSGIGEAKAQAIIEYREKNGKFNKIEDLKNVDGIGDALFEKVKDHITV